MAGDTWRDGRCAPRGRLYCLTRKGGSQVLQLQEGTWQLRIFDADSRNLIRTIAVNRSAPVWLSTPVLSPDQRMLYAVGTRNDIPRDAPPDSTDYQTGLLVRIDLTTGASSSTVVTRGAGLAFACVTANGRILGTQGNIVPTDIVILEGQKFVTVTSGGKLEESRADFGSGWTQDCSPSGRYAITNPGRTVGASIPLMITDTRTGKAIQVLATSKGRPEWSPCIVRPGLTARTSVPSALPSPVPRLLACMIGQGACPLWESTAFMRTPAGVDRDGPRSARHQVPLKGMVNTVHASGLLGRGPEPAFRVLDAVATEEADCQRTV